MVIQIQSKWFSLVLVIGDGGEREPPPAKPQTDGPRQLPTGTDEARRPAIIGFVK